MTRRAAPLSGTTLVLLLVLGLFAGIHRVAAQSALQPESQPGQQQRLPAMVPLGPRLLDYSIQCIDSSACRVQCFQQGTKVIDREHINKNDRLRMFASSSTEDELIPRWIEIRSADGRDAQTVLLSSDTTCDLKSLIISPNPRP